MTVVIPSEAVEAAARVEHLRTAAAYPWASESDHIIGRITEPEWWATARALQATGLNYTQIGRELGHCPSAVWKALNPEARRAIHIRNNSKPGRQEAKNANDRAQRPPCPSCGHPFWARHGATQCVACHRLALRSARDARRQRIADLWGQGASMKEIATALSTTVAALKPAMADMRRDGWDLPYRYAWKTRDVAA